jgi:hypothetical protein
MAVISSLDIVDKHIHLLSGVTEYHPVDDIYKEVRALRRTDETLRVMDVPVTAAGFVDKGGGKYTPRYAIFNNGWRVVPFDESQVLNITGEQITDDGQSGAACLDLSELSAASKVLINYTPSEAEVIVITTGSGVTEQDKTDIISGVWANLIDTLTAEELLTVLLSVASGKTTITDLGGGNATVRFRDTADTKDVVVASLSDSERTSITLNP